MFFHENPVLDKAVECGLNLRDAATVYGEGSSERIMGNRQTLDL